MAQTITEHIREHALLTAGFFEHKPMPSLEQLSMSEWDKEFETLMRNRLIMGAFRYGLLAEKNDTPHDNVGSAISRLNKYRESGNTELLVDVANICLVEFKCGHHPNKHFSSVDDGEHITIKGK